MLLKMKEIWIARMKRKNIQNYSKLGISDCFFLNYEDRYIRFVSYSKGVSHKGKTKGINWKRWNSRNSISIKVLKMSKLYIEPLTSPEKLKVEDLMRIVEHYKDYFETCGFKFDPKKLRNVIFD